MRVLGALTIASLALGAAVLGAAVALDHELPETALERATSASDHLIISLVEAPLVEEIIHRGALCLALVLALGRWPAVLLSGVAFGALHAAYGNFAPNHPLAGMILAWCYVKSGRLWVPVAFHCAGNVFALCFELAVIQLRG